MGGFSTAAVELLGVSAALFCLRGSEVKEWINCRGPRYRDAQVPAGKSSASKLPEIACLQAD